MANIDLHIHSKFSERPSEWFLQRIGAQESYTEPKDIYELAQKNNMQFVTITDHNSIEGALELKKKYPDECFVSVESTVYFPEDHCKIHLLIYGIDQEIFDRIQELRTDIYRIRDFIREEKLAYSVAHATYAVNRKLTVTHFEKLVLLFDTFEIINGSRSKKNNDPLYKILKSLTKEKIEELRKKHNIEPISDTPWIKGFTGGSDDHAGLFAGKAYTTVPGNSVKDILDNIRNKHSIPRGISNNYRSLAFAIYKIAYEFSKSKSGVFSQSLASQLTDRLFSSGTESFRSKLKMKAISRLKRSGSEQTTLHELYHDLLNQLSNAEYASNEEKLDAFYDKLAIISDEFFNRLLISATENVEKGDIFGLLRNVSSSLPGVFLSIPFFSTQKHFSDSSQFIDSLEHEFGLNGSSRTRQILWFTDTLTDLNGVSVIVKKIGWLSSIRGVDITIVTSLPEDQLTDDLPPNVINLNYFHELDLPRYEELHVRFPSPLAGMKQLDSYNPDTIYISTPGPVGLFGMLLAKILNTKSIGIYHTDFTVQAREIFDDATVENLIESYIRWFYLSLNEIKCPTKEYTRILSGRGYESRKLTVFKRGIDSEMFSPKSNGRDVLKQYGINGEFTMLYAGRVSKDKNIRFLINIHRILNKKHQDVKLVIAGDGPELNELKLYCGDDNSVIFTGKLDREKLPEIYSGADLFVFPSTTDTYGMVVAEAQSCGLPAVVTDKGGPKELVIHEKTGYVVRDDAPEEWERTISDIISMQKEGSETYKSLCENARRNVVENANWDNLLNELVAG